MKIKGTMSQRILRSTIWLAGTAMATSPAMLLAQEKGQATGVEDIVVTAQKREQNLQVVPISITAITSASIVANRIQDVRDLSAIAPNLTVRQSGGGAKIPVYSMRGILSAGAGAGTDKGVALYIDGVYVQNVVGSVFELGDIERIEVLKGPQGTLFGRNATGGAISIITRDPTGKFGVKQDLTYGNYDQLRSKTRIDLPKFGPISASVTYLHSERRGDTRNLGAGTVWDYGPATGGKIGKLTSPKYLGSENTEAIAAAVKFDFHPDLDLVYKFDYSQNHYTPEASGLGYMMDNQTLTYGGVDPSLLFLRALYETSPNPKTPITSKRPGAVNNWFTTPGFNRTIGHNLTAKYRVINEISIKNILAFRESKLHTTFQLDGMGGLVNALPVGGGVVFPIDGTAPTGSPFGFLLNNASNNERQWSNEFQVNVNTDWFNLTAGYIHFHDFARPRGFENVFNTIIVRGVAGQNTSADGTPFTILANPGYLNNFVRVNSDAVYIQPEIHLTDRLDIVGGARITRDAKDGTEFSPTQPLDPALPRISAPIHYRDSRVSVLAGVNYRPTDAILTYLKYSTGYISGGQLATIAFKPETAKSWEAGIKADLFDRRVRSNLAVFKVKYGSIQFGTSGTITGVASAFPYSVAVVPSADAKAWGVEWENTVVPVDGLTLTANLGYLDFKFDQSSVFPGFVFQAGAPGYQRFVRPKWTGNVAAQYETGEIVAGGHLIFRADANFTSKTLLSSDITPGVGPDAQADPRLVAATTIPFKWIVNGRIALADLEMGGTKAEVALWGRNILNDKSLTQIINLGPVSSSLYERARTYGIDVSLSF